ncbi:hypothetical protein H2203_008533 [Taxawa tesnikishii (nom. ined.)]|nr:hypothetical protein H2203_008533 [Dothideales sp. JES 119]
MHLPRLQTLTIDIAMALIFVTTALLTLAVLYGITRFAVTWCMHTCRTSPQPADVETVPRLRESARTTNLPPGRDSAAGDDDGVAMEPHGPSMLKTRIGDGEVAFEAGEVAVESEVVTSVLETGQGSGRASVESLEFFDGRILDKVRVC